MRYCPEPSVTAERTFSISTGLDASTVTPGSTAPDVSLTTPVMDAWAYTAAGRKMKHAHRLNTFITLRMKRLLVPLPRGVAHLIRSRHAVVNALGGQLTCGRPQNSSRMQERGPRQQRGKSGHNDSSSDPGQRT